MEENYSTKEKLISLFEQKCDNPNLYNISHNLESLDVPINIIPKILDEAEVRKIFYKNVLLLVFDEYPDLYLVHAATDYAHFIAEPEKIKKKHFIPYINRKKTDWFVESVKKYNRNWRRENVYEFEYAKNDKQEENLDEVSDRQFKGVNWVFEYEVYFLHFGELTEEVTAEEYKELLDYYTNKLSEHKIRTKKDKKENCLSILNKMLK